MNFIILTLFPKLVSAFYQHGIIFQAIKKNLIKGHCIDIRDFAENKHNKVDDKIYGGGKGMLMTIEPLQKAIAFAKTKTDSSKVVLMSPKGKRFSQKKAFELALENKNLVFVCGRYEGMDERIRTELIDEEISIGDYVMTGGELASMVVIDSISRLIPGVLGSDESSQSDSFINDRLEYAQYTRPKEFDGEKVPDILLSGDHVKIDQWREKSSLVSTFLKRPDLFEKTKLNQQEKAILKQWCQELESLIKDND